MEEIGGMGLILVVVVVVVVLTCASDRIDFTGSFSACQSSCFSFDLSVRTSK